MPEPNATEAGPPPSRTFQVGLVGTLIVAASVLAGPISVADSAQPALLASQSGTTTCENTMGGDNFAQSFAAGLPASSIRRVSFPVVPGPSTVNLSDPLTGTSFFGGSIESGQVAWYTAGRDIRPGGSETWFFQTCAAGTSFTVDWFARPSVPVDFQGAGSSLAAASRLGFAAPGGGQYVLDLRLAQGAVAVNGRTVSSSQTISLGKMIRGDHEVTIRGVSVTPALWAATIRALPVEITAPKVSAGAIRPGHSARLSYAISGDTRVTVFVLDAGKRVVRTLVAQREADQGDQAAIFDGRLLDGRRLPDGRYSLRIVSDDYAPAQRVAEVSIAVDGTRPAARPLNRRVSPLQPIRFRLRDAPAGIAWARVRIGGLRLRTRVTPTGTLVVLPPRTGWRSDLRSVSLSVRDRAGNELRRSFPVSVR